MSGVRGQNGQTRLRMQITTQHYASSVDWAFPLVNVSIHVIYVSSWELHVKGFSFPLIDSAFLPFAAVFPRSRFPSTSPNSRWTLWRLINAHLAWKQIIAQRKCHMAAPRRTAQPLAEVVNTCQTCVDASYFIVKHESDFPGSQSFFFFNVGGGEIIPPFERTVSHRLGNLWLSLLMRAFISLSLFFFNTESCD